MKIKFSDGVVTFGSFSVVERDINDPKVDGIRITKRGKVIADIYGAKKGRNVSIYIDGLRGHGIHVFVRNGLGQGAT